MYGERFRGTSLDSAALNVLDDFTCERGQRSNHAYNRQKARFSVPCWKFRRHSVKRL